MTFPSSIHVPVTTNQITIILPLLLVYSLLTTINHHYWPAMITSPAEKNEIPKFRQIPAPRPRAELWISPPAWYSELITWSIYGYPMEMMIPKFNLDLNLGSFKIIVDDDYSGWCGHSGHSLSLSGSERTSPIDGCFVFFWAIWYPLHRAFGYPNLPVLDDDLPVVIWGNLSTWFDYLHGLFDYLIGWWPKHGLRKTAHL